MNRRSLLKGLAGGLAAAAIPGAVRGGEAPAPGPLPSLAPGAPADEAYWRMVKSQFAFDEGRIHINAANLCPSSYAVTETQIRLTRLVDADPSSQNRRRFSETREASRAAIARYVGADPGEIVITRNTTEGTNLVIQGLGLGAGDEVVIWDENHACNHLAWERRAERQGFKVVKVAMPREPRSAADLVAPFRDAITPATRVFGLTHASNQTGTALPLPELCALARERGIVTLIDGVQGAGAAALDLHSMGCDFYAASTHKWMMGPREVGFLYIREPWLDRLEPALFGVPWGDSRTGGPRQFEMFGQRNDAAVASAADGIALLESIGKDRVEARVRALATALVDRLARHEGVDFGMPLDPALRLGIVTFRLPGVDSGRLASALYDEDRIACSSMSGRVRLSPQVYNTMADIERVLDAIEEKAAILKRASSGRTG